MKFIVSLVLLVSGCVTHTIAPPSSTNIHVNRAVELAGQTVTVSSGCSGVWVSSSYILTASHCVDTQEIGDAIAYDGAGATKSTFAILKDKSAEVDLAVIEAYMPTAHGIARLSVDEPAPGDFVQTMGHPFGLWYSYSAGYVAAIREVNPGWMPHAITWVQATAPISPGDSGCGLFNEAGELIGVTSWGYIRGQNLNFFVHRDHILEFLNRSLPAPARHPSSPRGGGSGH